MSKTYEVVAANGRQQIGNGIVAPSIVLRDGNTFFVRSLDRPDQPIPWDGDDPEMMIAALVTKWGFAPCEPRTQVDDVHWPVCTPQKRDDGAEYYAVETVIDGYEVPTSGPQAPAMAP